jgi:hypothetical protein
MPCPNGGRPSELCGPALGSQRRHGRPTLRSLPSARIQIIRYPAHARCTRPRSIFQSS